MAAVRAFRLCHGIVWVSPNEERWKLLATFCCADTALYVQKRTLAWKRAKKIISICRAKITFCTVRKNHWVDFDSPLLREKRTAVPQCWALLNYKPKAKAICSANANVVHFYWWCGCWVIRHHQIRLKHNCRLYRISRGGHESRRQRRCLIIIRSPNRKWR